MDKFDLHRIDGHTLRIFSSVCQTKSVSRTAEIFELNQSTISHSIDKMRAAVGDQLFVKSGRGIIPTEKSLILYTRVQRILADIEGLLEADNYDAAYDSKPFRIGLPSPAFLQDMKKLHSSLTASSPDARLELCRLVPRSRVAEMLELDEADLTISVGSFRYPATLNYCRYGSDEFVVFYDPEVREEIRTVEEYSSARHGLVDHGGNMKSVVETSLLEMNLKRKITMIAPTTSMLGDLIKGTDIIATMPKRLADSAFSTLSYSTPPLELPDVVYDLVWHRRYEYSGRNSWLREKMLEISDSLYTTDSSLRVQEN